jgi:hypothetical protein
MDSGKKALITVGLAGLAVVGLVWLAKRSTVAAVTEAGVLECEGWEECEKAAAWEATHPGESYRLWAYYNDQAAAEKLIREQRARNIK